MNIQHEINNIKYVMIEEFLDESTKDKIGEKVKTYACLIQGIKIHRHLFFKSYVIMKVLVPEIHILNYMHKTY